METGWLRNRYFRSRFRFTADASRPQELSTPRLEAGEWLCFISDLVHSLHLFEFFFYQFFIIITFLLHFFLGFFAYIFGSLCCFVFLLLFLSSFFLVIVHKHLLQLFLSTFPFHIPLTVMLYFGSLFTIIYLPFPPFPYLIFSSFQSSLLNPRSFSLFLLPSGPNLLPGDKAL